jgi:hypothetical protein
MHDRIYSGQCVSALFVNFIPIMIYLYTIIALSLPLGIFFLLYTDPEKMPQWMRAIVPGIIYPQKRALFKHIIRVDSVVVNQMIHLAVLLTFGIASPVMAVSIGIVMVSELKVPTHSCNENPTTKLMRVSLQLPQGTLLSNHSSNEGSSTIVTRMPSLTLGESSPVYFYP